MKPVGYFEGESMTRRKVFAVAGQAFGGLAGAAIVLPALGFAVAPIFDKPEDYEAFECVLAEGSDTWYGSDNTWRFTILKPSPLAWR